MPRRSEEEKRVSKRHAKSSYRIVQPPFLSLLVFTESATRAASVKASLTPLFFMAEHSVHV